MDKKVLIRLLQHRVKELELVLNSMEGSEQIHEIEIDLLLSKIRLIYDDVKLLSRSNTIEEKPAGIINKELVKPVAVREPEPEIVLEPEVIPEPEIVPEPEVIPEPEIIPEPEVIPEPEIVPEPEVIPEPVVFPEPELVYEPEVEHVVEPEEEQVPEEDMVKDKTTLLQEPKEKILTNIKMQTVDDIMIAIGLNDRFLFIRELFNNDADFFKSTIDTLNVMDSWRSAGDYLSENFSWDPEDPTLTLFLSVVKRRFV